MIKYFSIIVLGYMTNIYIYKYAVFWVGIRDCFKGIIFCFDNLFGFVPFGKRKMHVINDNILYLIYNI